MMWNTGGWNPSLLARRILLFGLHLILQSQFGSVALILLVGFEVIFRVLATYDRDRAITSGNAL